MNLKQSLVLLTAAGLQSQVPANACTGITLKAVMAQLLPHVLLNGRKA